LDQRFVEGVVADVEHLQRLVLLGAVLGLEDVADLLDVAVFEATRPQEEHLKALAGLNQFGERGQHLFAVLVCFWGLIDLVLPCSRAVASNIACVFIDGVPVEEEVKNRAVLTAHKTEEEVKHADGETVVLEFESKSAVSMGGT